LLVSPVEQGAWLDDASPQRRLVLERVPQNRAPPRAVKKKAPLGGRPHGCRFARRARHHCHTHLAQSPRTRSNCLAGFDPSGPYAPARAVSSMAFCSAAAPTRQIHPHDPPTPLGGRARRAAPAARSLHRNCGWAPKKLPTRHTTSPTALARDERGQSRLNARRAACRWSAVKNHPPQYALRA
jgi:hypothetical protein